jgi:micrococcal nuclease
VQTNKKIKGFVRLLLGLISLLPFALTFTGCRSYIPTTVLGRPFSATGITVIKVYDGDTFTVELSDGTVEKVRLIGIDAPELRDNVHGDADIIFGPQARDYLADLVANAEVILIPGVKERDNYGRLLAYVYTEDYYVNLEMVRAGYAVVYTVPPDVRDADIFLKAEREAREAGRGLWNK